MDLTNDQIKKFDSDGYIILEDFLASEEVEALKKECGQIVEDMNPEEHQTVFSTTKQSHRDDYFMNSGDKVRFFYEEGVLDDKGQLQADKRRCLNKIGHALHVLCPSFRRVTFGKKMQDLARSVGYKDPAVPQSMYIFKQPHIGGEVTAHQDATFLYTEPVKVMGIWIALEDATLENGCLWFIPGSHKDGIYGDYRMIRNKNRTENSASCIYIGEKPTYDDSRFIPTPVKAGSLVMIDGTVVHKSEQNTSSKSRHIYTFHLFDRAEVVWSSENWLQSPEGVPFPGLYSFGEA